MQLTITVDPHGVVQVELLASPDESQDAHRFWQVVRPMVEELDARVQAAANTIGKLAWSRDDDSNP